MDLQNLLLGEVLFFFSGLMTGPTYRPLVRHSNADTPLGVADNKTVTVSHYTAVTAPLMVTGLPVRLNETKREFSFSTCSPIRAKLSRQFTSSLER